MTGTRPSTWRVCQFRHSSFCWVLSAFPRRNASPRGETRRDSAPGSPRPSVVAEPEAELLLPLAALLEQLLHRLLMFRRHLVHALVRLRLAVRADHDVARLGLAVLH